jgi:S1-C subfamily serine protease
MPLDAQRLGQVRELLPHCTARILTGGGKAYGSGFFIDDGLLLTCGHVVKGKQRDDEVEVAPFMRPSRPGKVSEIVEGQEEFDLALIEVEAHEDEDPFPAVALDKAMGDHIDYYAAGFPKNPIGGQVGFEEIVFRAHRSRVGETANMLLFEAGQAAVTRGLSGGPVMHSETGAVVALVQYSNNPTGDSGGGAIPITRAAQHFERVKRALDPDLPPVAAARWRDALGREYWEGLGKPWDAGRWIDLVIGGDSRCWKV